MQAVKYGYSTGSNVLYISFFTLRTLLLAVTFFTLKLSRTNICVINNNTCTMFSKLPLMLFSFKERYLKIKPQIISEKIFEIDYILESMVSKSTWAFCEDIFGGKFTPRNVYTSLVLVTTYSNIYILHWTQII